jgi:hypothetical protein
VSAVPCARRFRSPRDRMRLSVIYVRDATSRAVQGSPARAQTSRTRGCGRGCVRGCVRVCVMVCARVRTRARARARACACVARERVCCACVSCVVVCGLSGYRGAEQGPLLRSVQRPASSVRRPGGRRPEARAAGSAGSSQGSPLPGPRSRPAPARPRLLGKQPLAERPGPAVAWSNACDFPSPPAPLDADGLQRRPHTPPPRPRPASPRRQAVASTHPTLRAPTLSLARASKPCRRARQLSALRLPS